MRWAALLASLWLGLGLLPACGGDTSDGGGPGGHGGPGGPGGGDRRPVPVRVEQAQEGALSRTLERTGTLRTDSDVEVAARYGGRLTEGRHSEIVERTFATARSIEFDALVVADGAPKDGDFRAIVMLRSK